MESGQRFTMRGIRVFGAVLILVGAGLAVATTSSAQECKTNSCATATVTRGADGWKAHFKLWMTVSNYEFFNLQVPGYGQMEVDGPGNVVELDLDVSSGWTGSYAVQACIDDRPIRTNCDPWRTFQAELPLAADDRNFCVRYAGHATSAGQAAQQQNCGFDSPPGRWSTDNALHLNWCIDQFRGAGFDPGRLAAARSLANSEDAARNDGVKECQAKIPCPPNQMRLEGRCQVPPILSGTTSGTGGGFIQMFPECGPGKTYNQGENRCVADIIATPAPAQEQPPAPVGGGPLTASTCGLSGTATVVIEDPAIPALNVRDKPIGEIIGTIPEGTLVNVVGGCGVQIAAGIVAQKPGQVIPGWCAITSPKIGCVSEEFLVAGIAAGGQVTLPPAAGIVATQPQTVPQPQPPPVVAAPPPAGAGGQVARLTQGANIRSGPGSKNTTVLGSLPGGSVVTVVECTKLWCRLALPQHPVAWVFREFLAFDVAGAPAPAASIDVTINIGGGGDAPAPVQPPALPATGGGGLTASTCGLPGGTATVVIPDPKITDLNVRDKPKGEIIKRIPEGSQVNVVGGCGVQIAAGIVAQTPGTGGQTIPGWCAISSPVIGCVFEDFLVAGIPAGGQVSLPPAAGIVAAQPQTASAPTFTGLWNATAQGSPYTMTLDQNGNGVTGSYIGGDGSSGQINGTVSSNELRFSWQQADGLGGAGKYTLSADGDSFTGSFTLGNNPDVVEGSWNGTRR